MPLPAAIYDEALISPFELPEALAFQDGTRVGAPEEWLERRRAEVMELFESEVYGRVRRPPERLEIVAVRCERGVLDGAATRKQIRIALSNSVDGDTCTAPLDVLLYLPEQRRAPTPVFLGLNFCGNHAVHPDRGIDLNPNWMRNSRELGIADHRAREEHRGVRRGLWPVERLLARGYGLATVYCGDIDPDFDDGYDNGVHPLFRRPGRTFPEVDDPGSIGAWAWGLSRVLDCLAMDDDVDPERVAVMGHSRLGKTALWAGATDERFALVVSNESGCGGAALSRRRFGETVEAINTVFPHWFCDNFRKYNGRENDLPVDQHMLIALNAPRPVYVASAADDLWSDPRGEFLAALHASPVYELLGTDGLTVEALGLEEEELPAVCRPLTGRIGHHLRPGGHGVTHYDWERYMDFADIHMAAPRG